MSVCKIIRCDLVEATLKSKRWFILIIITVLQCMLTQIEFDQRLLYTTNISYNFREILFGVLGGCAAFSKTGVATFPYGWFALFICTVFISFDYMRQNLANFGVQVLTRTEKRIRWWLGKCVWCVISSVISFLPIVITVAVFCLMAGIPITFEDNPNMLSMLTADGIYQSSGEVEKTEIQSILMLLNPLLCVITLNMLQMTLSLFIKPLFSFAAIIGIMVFSIVADWNVAVARMGMILYQTSLYTDGYDTSVGALICGAALLMCVFGGALYFKKYDILPSKEAD